jgi:hypothetical protein
VPVPSGVKLGLNHWKVIPLALVVPTRLKEPPAHTLAEVGITSATGSSAIMTLTSSLDEQPSLYCN